MKRINSVEMSAFLSFGFSTFNLDYDKEKFMMGWIGWVNSLNG